MFQRDFFLALSIALVIVFVLRSVLRYRKRRRLFEAEARDPDEAPRD
jgi:hypothetical protein